MSDQIKINLMDSEEVERFAAFSFNKVAAAERFEHLAMLYRSLAKMRRRGRAVSNSGAEEFAAKIEAGITIQKMEAWLLK